MGKAQQAKGKSSKKVKQDTFLKKEWRHVYVPGYFGKREIGYTVSHKCARGKTPGDYLNNRVFEISHGDLVDEQAHAYRLFSWRSVEVANNDVLTVFAGMRLSNDKFSSLLRKYRTLVEAGVDVRTPDGYILRASCIGFTKKLNANRKACYAQQSKREEIRNAMINTMRDLISSKNISDLCTEIISETMEKEINNKCQTIMQIDNVYVTKIKVIKAPVYTVEELKKLHQGRTVQKATPAARPEEAPAEEAQADNQ